MFWLYSFCSPSSPQSLLISTSIQLHVLTLKKAKSKTDKEREEEGVEKGDQQMKKYQNKTKTHGVNVVLANTCWEWDLLWIVVDTLSDAPVKKTDFASHGRYWLQIASLLEVVLCVHISFPEQCGD